MPKQRDHGLTRSVFLGRAAGAMALTVLGAPAVANGARGARFPTVGDVPGDVAARWFDLALELVERTPGYTPPVASRTLGYAGIALYESLVPGIEDRRSLGGTLPGLGHVPAAGRNHAYAWALVANAALAAAFRAFFPTTPLPQRAAIDALERELARREAASLPPGIVSRSEERGRDVAAAIFAWSTTDGGHEGYLHNFPPYQAPSGPGTWVPTPPGNLPALQPTWGANRCHVLPGGAACPPGDHPPYSEDPGSAFYAEAIEVLDAVAGLTPEQEAIARFWSDDPGTTPTPPGHSVSIATQALRREDADLATAAETYLRVGMAVSDAFVACWHTKYAYNLIRPVTYLQRLVDPAWLPILVTPPFPEYTSGHSVQSGAAFKVLTDLFGDDYAFVDHTHDARGLAPRAFSSFDAAAEEAAISRLYGGIHYRAAIDNGVAQGRCVGQSVSALPLEG